MPTRSTVLGFLSLALLLAVPVLLIAVHGPRSAVHAAVSTPSPEHVTLCFDEQTHWKITKAFGDCRVSSGRHQGCGLGLVQIRLELDSARELLGSLVASLNARDQAIERAKKAEQRDRQRSL